MKRLASIGAGKMAEAIISGILKQDMIPSSQVYALNKGDLEQLEYLTRTYEIHTSEDYDYVVTGSDVVLLAVKPKDAKEVLLAMKPYLKDDVVIISVMAGVSTQQIETLIEKEVAVIRVMPNTSAMIGLSASALSFGQYADETAMKKAEAIFQAVGITERIEEDQMHAITALSGSGPAYFYYMVEAMLKEANALGISEQTAIKFVNQTILGASHMLIETNEKPEMLRKHITSPNGTTEQGIKALDDAGVKETIQKAVRQAYQRSIELSRT